MKTLRILCIICIISLSAALSSAEVSKRNATITDIKGNVEVRTAAGAQEAAKAGMVLTEGDVIMTKADSWATLNLSGAEEATVTMKPNSQLALSELKADEKAGSQKTLLDLALGEVLVKTQKLHAKESKFEVKTPTSIVGVRGTTFSVAVEAVE
jgi:hypothetical protein